MSSPDHKSADKNSPVKDVKQSAFREVSQTFVQAPQGNEPVGLDVSDFDRPRQDQDMPNQHTQMKSDTEVINECL